MTTTRMRERGCTLFERGFSMVELMVALVVLGILIGMSVPSFTRYSLTQRLRGSCENLVQTIQLQRSRAMATGQDVIINFNTATPAAWTVMSQGRSNRFALPTGVSYVSANPTTITLSRDGHVSNSGLVVMRATTGVTDTVSIQLSGLALIR